VPLPGGAAPDPGMILAGRARSPGQRPVEPLDLQAQLVLGDLVLRASCA
jgi:hypothetical protein